MITIRIFISHSWAYSTHYNTLHQWIFETDHQINRMPIRFMNHSVTSCAPLPGDFCDITLEKEIRQQIMGCHVIVIPTGMYSAHSKWIQKEIEIALSMNKQILAVRLRGQKRQPGVVTKAAHDTVGWRQKSVIQGIWNRYNAHRSN